MLENKPDFQGTKRQVRCKQGCRWSLEQVCGEREEQDGVASGGSPGADIFRAKKALSRLVYRSREGETTNDARQLCKVNGRLF